MPQKPIWDGLAPSTKVLLFLQTVKETKMWAGTGTGIEDLTQKGMSLALGVSIPRLSKTLTPLLNDGLIRTERVRIQGLRRRPLAYSLTPAGTESAREEIKKLFAMNVKYTNTEGKVVKTDLGALIAMLGMEGNILGVLRTTPYYGKLDVKAAGEGANPPSDGPQIPKTYHPELVDLRDAIQISPHFVGRKKELGALNDFLAGSPARLFTLTGPAAMGKTSLVSRFVNSAMKTVSVAFHTCREWDTLRNVLEPIAELLNRMGRTRLQYVLRNELRPITLQDAADILKKDMKGVIALIIFDDIQKLSFDYRPLLKLFITSIAADDLASGSKGGGPPTWVKVVTTSREPLVGVFDHRDTVVKELVREMELKGLTESETRELLEKEKASDLPLEKVYELTQGHPLHVELITRSGLSGAARDFAKFIDTEVMVKLSGEDRAVLGCISVFKMPVPASAIRIPQATTESLERLVKLGLVKETTLNEYEAPDIVIDAIYRQLKIDERRLYHSVAAKYHRSLKNEDSTAAAIRHMLSAEELTEALDLAAENAKALIRVGRSNLLEEVVKASKDAELPTKGVVASCKVRSELALASGEWRMAQIYLEKALAAVKGDKLQEGRILAAQAHSLREQTKLDEALKKYEEAEKAATAIYDLPTIADIYRGQGKAYWRKGDFKNAIEYLDKSLDFLKAADLEVDYGETLIDIGLVNNRIGNNDEAIEYFNRGIEKLEKGGWIHPLARAYNNLGVEYFEKKDYEKAIACWQKCYQLAEKTGNKKGMIVSLENLSDPYSLKGDLAQALACLKTAKELVDETHDIMGLPGVYHSYGSVYSNIQSWDKAFEYYEKGLSILKNASTPFELALILYHYGIALSKSGNNKSAVEKLYESRVLFKECKAEKKVKEVDDLLHKLGSS